MLNENIKSIRKSKGLSQEELAIKLNVVRQTISKWEFKSDFRKVGGHKSTARQKENNETKDISLGVYLIVCVDRNCFCGFIRAEQSILGVGLQ